MPMAMRLLRYIRRTLSNAKRFFFTTITNKPIPIISSAWHKETDQCRVEKGSSHFFYLEACNPKRLSLFSVPAPLRAPAPSRQRENEWVLPANHHQIYQRWQVLIRLKILESTATVSTLASPNYLSQWTPMESSVANAPGPHIVTLVIPKMGQ